MHRQVWIVHAGSKGKMAVGEMAAGPDQDVALTKIARRQGECSFREQWLP